MKDVLLNPALDRFAVYAIFVSMALYTVAFLTFVWHLSRLSSTKVKLRKSAVSLERSALAITILAFLFHAAGVVMRGIAAARVPLYFVFGPDEALFHIAIDADRSIA